MNEEMKRKIIEFAIDHGCDSDGGFVQYENKHYFVHIFRNIVQEVN